MKKNYIAPTSKVYWIGLRKGIADKDVPVGNVSAYDTKRENVWGNDAAAATGSSSSNGGVWDDEW